MATLVDRLTLMAQAIAADIKALYAYIPKDNISQFGAKGDGLTDDTAAMQAAIDALPLSGGTVYFGAGKTYRQIGTVFLRDNITIDMNGSIIAKKPGDNYHAFKGKSYHGTGYKGGPQNVTLKNGTLKGSFTLGAHVGVGVTFHHAQDLKFENMKWLESMMGGHPTEFLGCNRVTFTNCTFEGAMPDVAQYRNEAIQCDYSYLIGGDIDSDNQSSYDALGCSNFLVQNCKFIPLSYAVPGGSARTVYAPNPIGTHVRMQDTYSMDGLTFKDNLIEGIRQTDDHTTATTRGWLHFFHAKNITISNNTFNNVSGRPAQAIQADAATGTTGYLKTDVTNPTAPGNSTITPMPATDWSIVGNTFNNFNASNIEGVIALQGFDTALTNPMLNIDIRGNQFRNCHPTKANSDTAPYLITVNRSVGTIITDNSVDYCGRFSFCNNNRGMLIQGNTIMNSYSEAMQCTSADHVRILNNYIGRCCGGIRVQTGTTVRVSGNNVVYATTATGAITSTCIQVRSGAAGNNLFDFLVDRNMCYGSSAAINNIQIHNGGGTVQRGRVVENLALGQTAAGAAGAINISGTMVDVLAPVTASTLGHNIFS